MLLMRSTKVGKQGGKQGGKEGKKERSRRGDSSLVLGSSFFKIYILMTTYNQTGYSWRVGAVVKWWHATHVGWGKGKEGGREGWKGHSEGLVLWTGF